MKKKILSVLLAVCMLAALMPAAAFADTEVKNILALGDSITTGYGLADASTEGFTALLAAKGHTVVNKAVDGNTAAGIAAQLADGFITEDEILAADVITITCGGNDLMALLYSKMADTWNAQNPNSPIEAADVVGIMKDPSDQKRLSLMMIALNVLDSNNPAYMLDDPDFSAAISGYIDTLCSIAEEIFLVNPDTEVIAATQYNPYLAFKDAKYMGFISLDPLYSGMETGAEMLNTMIKLTAESAGYTVADVKAACDAYTGADSLYNASAAALEVDFHPSAAGHAVIAETFAEAIAALPAPNPGPAPDLDPTPDPDPEPAPDPGPAPDNPPVIIPSYTPVINPAAAAKADASDSLTKYADPADYDDAEAAEIQAIIEQAEKDMTAAKTAEEVKNIEAAAKAEIDKLETAEEKALIAEVEDMKFALKSQKTSLNGKRAIRVTWDAPEETDFDGFEVYRSAKRYKGFGTKPLFVTEKETYTNNKGLKKGNTYYYKVRGFKYINDEKVYTAWSGKAWRTI